MIKRLNEGNKEDSLRSRQSYALPWHCSVDSARNWLTFIYSTACGDFIDLNTYRGFIRNIKHDSVISENSCWTHPTLLMPKLSRIMLHFLFTQLVTWQRKTKRASDWLKPGDVIVTEDNQRDPTESEKQKQNPCQIKSNAFIFIYILF